MCAEWISFRLFFFVAVVVVAVVLFALLRIRMLVNMLCVVVLFRSSSSPVVLIVWLSLRLCPTRALWLRALSHFIIVRSLWRFVLRVFYKLLGSNACNDNNDFDTPTLNSQRYVLP